VGTFHASGSVFVNEEPDGAGEECSQDDCPDPPGRHPSVCGSRDQCLVDGRGEQLHVSTSSRSWSGVRGRPGSVRRAVHQPACTLCCATVRMWE
jgi:hypothetical protein